MGDGFGQKDVRIWTEHATARVLVTSERRRTRSNYVVLTPMSRVAMHPSFYYATCRPPCPPIPSTAPLSPTPATILRARRPRLRGAVSKRRGLGYDNQPGFTVDARGCCIGDGMACPPPNDASSLPDTTHHLLPLERQPVAVVGREEAHRVAFVQTERKQEALRETVHDLLQGKVLLSRSARRGTWRSYSRRRRRRSVRGSFL